MTNDSRRKFLQYGALLATGLSAQAAEPKESTRAVKIAVKYYMVKEGKTLADKMKIVKELGFDGIELDSPNAFPLEEVTAAREAVGLPIIGVVDSVHWRDTLSHPDKSIQKKGVDGLLKAIDDAKAYGATSVLLVPAVVNKQVSYAQAWHRSQQNIREVIPHAEKQKIQILFENVWNKFLLSPLEFARYIDDFETPVVGAHFDIGNVQEFGFPEEWIRTLGKRIGKLDIKEYGFKNRFDYKLGEGDIDWSGVRRSLKDIGYNGWATAEIPAGDRDYLADVARRMDSILGNTK